MNTFPKFHNISSISKFFVLLTLILLLTNAAIVNAQNNANAPNVNVASPNVNADANGNANGNTNGNTNTNPNSNAGRNVNGNTNGNNNTNQNNNNNANTNGNDDKGEESRKDRLANSYWFYSIVTLMFLGLLAPFVWIIVRSIKFSGSTYRSPLGLPEGSFRAILAYTLVVFLGFYILASVLSLSDDLQPPDFLLGIVATVIGFYFGSRTAEDRGFSTRTVGIVQGSIKDKNGTAAVGATIDLSQSGSKKFTQNADVNGNYKFDNVPVGDYDIQASLSGHSPSNVEKVKVVAGATQTINLSLK